MPERLGRRGGGEGGWGEWALVLPTFLQTINWRVGDWTSPLHPNSPVLWLVIPLPLPFQETAQATLYSGTRRTLKPRSHLWSKDRHKRKLKKSAGKSQCENAWNKHKRNHKKNWAYRYLFFVSPVWLSAKQAQTALLLSRLHFIRACFLFSCASLVWTRLILRVWTFLLRACSCACASAYHTNMYLWSVFLSQSRTRFWS